MRMRDEDGTRSRCVLVAALTVFATVALIALGPVPADAAGPPVPPFEDETWRIDITHSDEYWLNVRYMVFPPGWSYDDGGFSGALVTGHSGCGDPSAPMLLNTARTSEGEHEIIVYFGGHCTHIGDTGEETKYDRYPNGTQISVDATLERFLPGESAPIETIPLSGTVVVTTDAPPPVWLWSIAVSAVEPQADAPGTTTTSSTTAEEDEGTASASGGEDSDEAATDTESGSDQGMTYSFFLLMVALMLGGLTLSLLIGYLVRRQMGWGRRDALKDVARAEGLEYKPSDPTTPGSDELEFLERAEVSDGEKTEAAPVPPPPPPSPSSPPASAEPQPVAEQQATEAFANTASDELGELAPSSPPKGKLSQGCEWVWVAGPLEVDYYEGGFDTGELVQNTLQPGRWYQASPRNQHDSRIVWTEDGKHMLGDKVYDVRFVSDQNTPPSPRS